MRSKKQILLVDGDEETLSIRTFFLESRGFRVLKATSAAAAILLFRTTEIRVVVIDLGLCGMGNRLIIALKNINPEVPMILTSNTVGAGEQAHRADAFLGRGRNSHAELLERVKVMSARKRGPKKAIVSVPVEMAS